MVDIATEDDLWKLFFETPQDPTKKGDGYIPWRTLDLVLSAKSYGDGTKPLKMACVDRFYHVTHEAGVPSAIVCQRDLRKIARVLGGMGDTYVGYVGLLPNGETILNTETISKPTP